MTRKSTAVSHILNTWAIFLLDLGDHLLEGADERGGADKIIL